MRIETLDLDFGRTAETIAAFLVLGPESPVLIETGPASTLPTLLRRLDEHGVAPSDIRHVLVTHIHLDHAGAAGWWAQQGATVYVHPLGARHLIDPRKLLASAARIYGDRMDELWGRSLPAPEDRVVAVEDGETIRAGGLEIVPIETPGHARHHHVYRLGEFAFTGDAAGIRLPGKSWIDLPAPPPEFDLSEWKRTLERLRAERFATIYRTHFGPTSEVAEQLDTFEGLLQQASTTVRDLIERGAERDEMVEAYCDGMRSRAAASGVDDETAEAYELANPRYMSVDGIARYWNKLLAQP
jgi:glyoxylase-like metal-dependent hydrolase (beta-lactamase superfamily II)